MTKLYLQREEKGLGCFVGSRSSLGKQQSVERLSGEKNLPAHNIPSPRSIPFFLFFVAAILLVAGCNGSESKNRSGSETTPAAETGETASLDLSSPNTPEGLTDHFFAAFFSGKDEEAWLMLTPKAREATREHFTAQASDTITWRVTRKNVEGNIAYVFVDVCDLNDEGDASKEELVFALRQNDGQWGVAGFTAGELGVNFEEKAFESFTQTPSASPERVARNPDPSPLH